ncbi:MAG: NADH-quinone oxidoreductase subunit J [Anaerolineae bacterium]|nr:NADH-quinone oxidoreductase subunit J [Anaerolineae bacterium]
MELTLFIIVGAIAVLSAAMMLISENAVYSALFLILNFACIAFFFLMLNAPFLAMVQITVYAGAIMVLFLFVIMLLGAERIMTGDFRYPWLTPAAVILALVFLVAASAAIIDGDIDFIEEHKPDPYVRAVHAVIDAGELDFYLDDTLIASGLAYEDSSDFELWTEAVDSRHTVRLFEAGADPASAEPLGEEIVEINAGEALSFVAVASGTGDMDPKLIVATEDVTFNEESGTARVVAVNALAKWSSVAIVDKENNTTLIEDLPYGQASAGVLLKKGKHSISVYPDGNDQNQLAVLKNTEFDDNTSVLWVLIEERQEGNTFESRILNIETSGSPSFGSPTHVGRLLFTHYVLPFEMVALLLLVAMIGAIVLTHESLAPREPMTRRLANPPAGLDQPIIGKPEK